MSEKIVQLNEELIKGQIKELRPSRVNPKFCVNAKSWCKIEQNNVKAGAAQAAAALSIK